MYCWKNLLTFIYRSCYDLSFTFIDITLYSSKYTFWGHNIWYSKHKNKNYWKEKKVKFYSFESYDKVNREESNGLVAKSRTYYSVPRRCCHHIHPNDCTSHSARRSVAWYCIWIDPIDKPASYYFRIFPHPCRSGNPSIRRISFL